MKLQLISLALILPISIGANAGSTKKYSKLSMLAISGTGFVVGSAAAYMLRSKKASAPEVTQLPTHWMGTERGPRAVITHWRGTEDGPRPVQPQEQSAISATASSAYLDSLSKLGDQIRPASKRK